MALLIPSTSSSASLNMAARRASAACSTSVAQVVRKMASAPTVKNSVKKGFSPRPLSPLRLSFWTEPLMRRILSCPPCEKTLWRGTWKKNSRGAWCGWVLYSPYLTHRPFATTFLEYRRNLCGCWCWRCPTRCRLRAHFPLIPKSQASKFSLWKARLSITMMIQNYQAFMIIVA